MSAVKELETSWTRSQPWAPCSLSPVPDMLLLGDRGITRRQTLNCSQLRAQVPAKEPAR